jgi:kumamolisin
MRNYIRRPHAVSAALTVAEVAGAYDYPVRFVGKGITVGIIELGGGYSQPYFDALGWHVAAISVNGGKNAQDGPNGADAEVQLDIEVVGSLAPAAQINVYFAPNTEAGFLAAVKLARAQCDVISISWGQAENQWSLSAVKAMSVEFQAARASGVTVFAAAGDSGSNDSTSAPVTDYPASDPNVVGCGGTRLTLNPDGSRASEVVWDDNDTTSATGGGVSKVFPGRDVPDVAGNADPQTGYQVTIDGGRYVIGGTSAVAPLYAGQTAATLEALGDVRFDYMNTVVSNPSICYDVTAGDNGAFRAGPGRDQTTGFGVVDGGRLLAVLQAGTTPPSPPDPGPTAAADAGLVTAFEAWETTYWAKHTKAGRTLIAAGEQWESAHGYEPPA